MMDDDQVADSALQNMEEAIRIGRTDVVVRTMDLAAQHFNDGHEGVTARVLNRRMANGGTCLHLAVLQGHVDALRVLLNSGADPSVRNASNKTAYQLAATPRIQAPFTSYVMEAVARGNIAAVSQMLAAGMSINFASTDNQMNTLLHWACAIGQPDTVKYLLSRKPRLDIANTDGMAPLHEAARRWDAPIIEMLLANGADPNARVQFGPHEGSTAADLVPSPHSWSEVAVGTGSAALTKPSPLISSNSVDDGEPVATSMAGEPLADHPMQILWPPPAILRCMEGQGFPFADSFPAYFDQTDSTEPFATAVATYDTSLSMFEALGKPGPLSILPSGPLPSGALVLSVNADLFSTTDSYNLTVSHDRVRIEASNTAGLWYAMQTLSQMICICERNEEQSLPALYIRDWPDLKYRGFMLDLMQGRLPTLETLKVLVCTMSHLKMNMLQLRMGATSFAYAGFEDLWHADECYLPSEMLELSMFAKQHFVTLVPHQDTASLVTAVLKQRQEHQVTTQDVVAVMTDLHKQLFASFPDSKFAHVGLDQPLKDVVQPSQASDADFDQLLWSVHSSCRLHRRGMQVWGSELQIRSQLLAQLPSSVVVMQPLGQFTQENNAPFCRVIAQSGVNLMVCPDTLGKEAVGGRPHTSIAQLVAVAQCAVRYKAVGMMLTDFSEFGHNHPLLSTVVPLVATAGLSWRTATPQKHVQDHVPSVINYFVMNDEADVCGQLLMDLQLVHVALLSPRPAGKPSPLLHRHGSVTDSSSSNVAGDSLLAPAAVTNGIDQPFLSDELWWQPTVSFIALRPEQCVLPVLSAEAVQSALREVRHCQAVLASLRLCCPQSTAILSELSFIIELFMFVCRAIKQLILSSKASGNAADALSDLSLTARTDLANRFISLEQLFKDTWLLRNKQGSLDKSSLFFRRTLTILHNGVK